MSVSYSNIVQSATETTEKGVCGNLLEFNMDSPLEVTIKKKVITNASEAKTINLFYINLCICIFTQIFQTT